MSACRGLYSVCFRRWYQFPHLRYSGSEELFRTVKKELAVFQLYQIRRTDKSCCHLFPACIPYTMTYYYSTPNKYQFQILSEKNYTIKTYFFSRLKGVNIVTILLLQSLTKQILCKYCCIKNVVEITGFEPVTF